MKKKLFIIIRWMRFAFYCFALIMGLYIVLDVHMWSRLFPFFMSQEAGMLAIGFLLSAEFLKPYQSKKNSEETIPWYNFILSILCLLYPFYIFFNFSSRIILQAYGISPPIVALVLAIIFLIIIVIICHRSYGSSFIAVFSLFTIYPLVARELPSLLHARGWSFTRTMGHLFFTTEGVLGLPITVLLNILIGFFILIVALNVLGGSEFINDFAIALGGRLRGGPAKVAIIASGLFGSISGSALANVASTGSITIPLMKKNGYSAEYAAAIEAAASTGGHFMPPIMGTVAFIMAQWLEIPYTQIVLVGFIPALMFYLSIFLQADLQAMKLGIKGLPREAIPSVIKTLPKGVPMFIGVGVLLYFLLELRMMPARSAFYAFIAVYLISFINPATRPNLEKSIEMIERSGKTLLAVVPALLGAGLILGSVMLTGLGGRFTSLLLVVGGGNFFVSILLTMIASAILGMGLPVVGVYIITAILLAPAIAEFGVPLFAIHFALLYWSTLSFITPPVAFASYVAAGIAGCSPIKAAIKSCILGLPAFFVPVIMLLRPEFLFQGGTIAESITVIVGGLVLIMSLGFTAESYSFLGIINWQGRILAFVGCILQLVGLVVGCTIFFSIGVILVVAGSMGAQILGMLRKRINVYLNREAME